MFDDKFNEILKLHSGVKFYWADLHIHTPSWYRFTLPKGTTKDDKEEIAGFYVQEAIKKDLKILGITEHNDVEWIDHIRSLAISNNIVIFPGFEITTQSGKDGIHLICLFNPDTSSDDLNHFLSLILELKPSERFNSDGTWET